jgi:hypothetical protein
LHSREDLKRINGSNSEEFGYWQPVKLMGRGRIRARSVGLLAVPVERHPVGRRYQSKDYAQQDEDAEPSPKHNSPLPPWA